MGRKVTKKVNFHAAFKILGRERKLSHLIQFLAQADNLVEGKESCGRLRARRKHEIVFTNLLKDILNGA